MSAEMIEAVCASLGVPPRIFEGSSYLPTLASAVLIADEIDRLASVRRLFTDKVIEPLMEQVFPELYWDTLFICSPRGRVMIRRKTPKLTVEWK